MGRATGHTCWLMGIALGVLVSGEAGAGGFFLPQQSVQGVGRAFIGGVAIAEDASTIFTNPAGMTNLPEAEVAIGISGLYLNLDVKDRGSTGTAPLIPVTVPLTQQDGLDVISPAVVPNFYAAHPFLDRRLWLGLGVSSPFGISVDYPNEWFGRYDSVGARLRTIDIAPSAAWRIDEEFSIGAGIDIQYADADLDIAVPNVIPDAAIFDPSTDGLSELDGDNWAVGFNIGVLFHPSPTTRIGLHYRSFINHDIDGTTKISNLRGPFAALNGTFGATTDLTFPDIVSFGFVHDILPELRIMGEAQWFAWSRFDELRIELDNGTSELRTFGYKNVWAAGVALEYRVDENWSVRSGFRYDETPTTNEFRDTIVPDSDNYWLAFGASYRNPIGFAVDLSYAHTFFDDAKIDVTRSSLGGAAVSRVRARSENSGNTFSINARWRF